MYDDKLELLECTVFNKEKKKDAFEDMYEKIAEQASDIIKIQQRQEYEVELRAENFEFLKTEIYQNKKFVDDLREKHLLMMNDFHDLEEHIKEMQIKIVTGK